MSNYHLAQLNIAHLIAPIDSPQLADFVDNLDYVNGMAEQSEGFIWRLKKDDGNATSIDYFGDEIIANMSVWKDVSALWDFVYDSEHVAFLARKKEWFHKIKEAYMVLWWVPANHQPTLEEADERLKHLRQHGPSEFAFTFKKPFDSPSALAEKKATEEAPQ